MDISTYFENLNVFSIIVDAITIILLIILLVSLYRMSTKSKAKVMIVILFTFLYFISLVAKATLSLSIYQPIAIFWPVVLIVLFSDEFIEVTRKFDIRHKKRRTSKDYSHVVKTLTTSIEYLSKNKVGALFLIEASQNLDSLMENAIALDATISEELIETIFNTSTPLHDGAVVIREDKIKCAGVYLQPSSDENIQKTLGSRHRAALGASDLYDALIIVVSEESGKISVAKNGKLDRNLRKEDVIKYLEEYI